MHIAIAGNIGAGKTTLTKLLARHYNWKPHYESVDENPYLDDFYGEMERWSFNLQVYFLNSRFSQILELRKSGKNIIRTTKQIVLISSALCRDSFLLNCVVNGNILLTLFGPM